MLFDGLNPERLVVASQAVGVGRWCLARATGYARERVVFDVPIGAHQSIQHPLAEALVAARGRMGARRGGRPRARRRASRWASSANIAKIAACDAGLLAADRALQAFGGSGFTDETKILQRFVYMRLLRTVPVARELGAQPHRDGGARAAAVVLTGDEEGQGGRQGGARRGRRRRDGKRHRRRSSPRPGCKVTIVEVDEAAIERGLRRDRARASRSVGGDDGATVRARITATDRPRGRRGGADHVIETVVEDLEVKADVLRRLDAVCRDDVILASNTSQFPISKLAAATGRPDRVIGSHWFNPPAAMEPDRGGPRRRDLRRDARDDARACRALRQGDDRLPARTRRASSPRA